MQKQKHYQKQNIDEVLSLRNIYENKDKLINMNNENRIILEKEKEDNENKI